MLSSLGPRQLGQSDDNPEKHPESSSLGAHRWHLPADQSSAWEIDPSNMLGLSQ